MRAGRIHSRRYPHRPCLSRRLQQSAGADFGGACDQAANIARNALLRAGLPTSVAGMSIDRQCASGSMAIVTAAKQIIVGRMDTAVGGGVDSISLVQTPGMFEVL